MKCTFQEQQLRHTTINDSPFKSQRKSLHEQVSMPGTTRVTIITNHNKLRGELPQDIDWKPTSRHFSRRNLMIQRLQSYIVRCF